MRPFANVAVAALLSGSLSAQATAAAALPRPHIVVLLSDDAGYADFSMHGATDLQTPRIDSIAANGIRCSNGYVSACVCSPTRAGLLTGRYQQRFGHEFNFPAAKSETIGLPVEERTLADHLHAAGYKTMAFGKWHLGYAEHFHPCARGFDDVWGFLQGSRSYLPLAKSNPLNRLMVDRDAPAESFDYMTDELGRQAAKAIAARGKEPLFLYVAFNAVHTPMQATAADLEGTVGPAPRRKLIAMTKALDRAVGMVLDALGEAGIADDTLVFFLNDNGGATNNASRNGSLRGRKGQHFEGGIRVPFVAQWPKGLPKGVVCEAPVIALDIAATSLAAAGAPAPTDRPLDGANLLPVWRGETKAPPHATLYWRAGDNFALRAGSSKVVRHGANTMLFDLAKDPGERDDLAAQEPQRLQELLAQHAAWSKQMAAPRWGNAAANVPDEGAGKEGQADKGGKDD